MYKQIHTKKGRVGEDGQRVGRGVAGRFNSLDREVLSRRDWLPREMTAVICLVVWSLRAVWAALGFRNNLERASAERH